MEKRTLTTGEIAQYCNVNFRTVIRWIKRGHMKAYQLPGRGDNRVEVGEFIRFLHKYNMPVPAEFQPRHTRVLIVDDDRAATHAIQRALRRAGFETEIALDGFSAGALLESFSPQVMTLDLSMPGLGGLEVLRFVRNHSRLSQTRVLIISGMSAERLGEALEAGADEALAKPFDNSELVERVSRLAGVERAAVVTGEQPHSP